MIVCRIALILSRSASSSSSWCWPSTDRSVVCAIWDVATMKFSTWTIAAFGSTIRKYATAFTRTGTLSFVITSCGGTLSVIVRRSTLTILSMIGISRNRPGPFGSGSRRPSRKMTPALVLAGDLHRHEQEDQDDQDDDADDDQRILERPRATSFRRGDVILRRARARPRSPRPLTGSPGTSGLPSARRARQSSPSTSTSPARLTTPSPPTSELAPTSGGSRRAFDDAPRARSRTGRAASRRPRAPSRWTPGTPPRPGRTASAPRSRT